MAPECAICATTSGLVEFRDKHICNSCARGIHEEVAPLVKAGGRRR
jgi:hypothetical protein